MKSHFDVVIVGGGMVGLAAACALAAGALKIAVVEQRPGAPVPREGFDLRVSALTLATRTMFENLNVWPLIDARRVGSVRAMQIWNEGSGAVQFESADIGVAELAYIVENSVVQQALLARVAQTTHVHVICPATIDRIETEAGQSRVLLADGRVLVAKLLVGADGARSLVRTAANLETQTLDLNQQSIVATVTTEKPHGGIAYQRFLGTGPLAFLPLPPANTVSMVWSADRARAEELFALPTAGFVQALQTAFGEKLGKIVSVSERAAFPLTLSHAKRYVKHGVALIGDAAHTVHPLAGQGVNLGFLDAACLAQVVGDALGAHQDFASPSVLRRYERWRKGENLAMVSATGGFRYLYASALTPVSALRELGMNAFNALPPLKNFLARRASGLTGDLPTLARR